MSGNYSIRQGLLEQASFCASPNFDERPAGSSIDLLVIHCIALPPGCYGGACIEQLFCNRLPAAQHPYFVALEGVEVSAHFLVRRGGGLMQFVNCEQRAWHAGQSSFAGRERCNDYSIGIELEGRDDGLFTGAQYRVLAALSAAILRSYPAIGEDRIVGHEHIAPGRKTDPGPGFDWQQFRRLLAQDAN